MFLQKRFFLAGSARPAFPRLRAQITYARALADEELAQGTAIVAGVAHHECRVEAEPAPDGGPEVVGSARGVAQAATAHMAQILAAYDGQGRVLGIVLRIDAVPKADLVSPKKLSSTA